MRGAIVLVLVIEACASPASRDSVVARTDDAPRDARLVTSVPPTDSCGPLQPAPSWAGWRTGSKLDPCIRLSKCAEAGCAAATCLHQHYGCLDSGTISVEEERRLGTAFFVTVACCPN